MGRVKWVANNDLDLGCEQSFGLVHILPGKTNPEHWHTAAEEIVFMLQGECDVRLSDRDLKIGPGQTLYIPQGVKHEVANKGWEPVLYVCSFSASMRGTIFGNLRLQACDRCPVRAARSGEARRAPWRRSTI